MFERFTEAARHVVVDARAQARRLGHPHVGSEHLLLALVEADGPTSTLLHQFGLTSAGVQASIERIIGQPRIITDEDAAALERIGIDIQAVRAKIEAAFGKDALAPEVQPTRYGLFGRKTSGGPFTPRSKKVLELSLREAIRLKHNWIGTEHLLLGLIREGEGLAAQIMVEVGVDLTELRRAAEASFRAAA